MITIRRSDDRGAADHGWLKARHSFSFGEYYDPAHMGFRALRVINEDRIAPGGGFPTHPHRDMEIVTYILSGALEHRDSLGNGEVIRAGEVQRMSAGTGIRHSEFNASDSEPVHLLQIWLLPERAGIAPGYEQKALETRRGDWIEVATPRGAGEALTIHQDAGLYAARLDVGDGLSRDIPAGRHAWVQVARGAVSVNGQALAQGDAAALSDETTLSLSADRGEPAEVLVFDLA